MKLLLLLIYLLCSFAMAGETEPPKAVKPKQNIAELDKMVAQESDYFSIQPNDLCNQINAKQKGDTNWSVSAQGGLHKTRDFPELKEDKLTNVRFGGPNNTITYQFRNKKVVPNSLGENDQFSLAFFNLYDGDNKIIGKFNGLTKNEFLPTGREYKNGMSIDQEPIKFGVLYINKDPDSSPLSIKCEYVSDQIPLKELEKGRCYWIDSDSKAINGKPYCW